MDFFTQSLCILAQGRKRNIIGVVFDAGDGTLFGSHLLGDIFSASLCELNNIQFLKSDRALDKLSATKVIFKRSLTHFVSGFFEGFSKNVSAKFLTQSSACMAACDAEGTTTKVAFDNVLAVISPNSGGHTGSYSPAKINTGLLLTTGLNIFLSAMSGRHALQIASSNTLLKDENSGYFKSSDFCDSSSVRGRCS